MISQTKPLKIKSFSSKGSHLNLQWLKFVTVRSAGDGTRMGGI